MEKTLTSLILFFCLTFAGFSLEKTVYDTSKAVKDNGKKEFTETSAMKIVADMKTGWNLGNTLEATDGAGLSSETSWQQPKTTKAMIDGLAKSGMKTLRIPVSWHNHIIDKNYTIDPLWMNRVKEVVDWAIGNDMYVVLNTHHDCWEKKGEVMPAFNGYFPDSVNYEESSRFLVNVWSQICLAFNNGYDEHLVFETMNEPRLRGTEHEWWNDFKSADCVDAAKNLNKLNQDVVDTIRASGGNNQKRSIAIPGLQASPDSVLSTFFQLPKDTVKDRLIVSVHMYSPYRFAGESPGITKWSSALERELVYTFNRLNNTYIQKGVAVYIGEYGATNKNNLEARVTWFHSFLKNSLNFGMPSFLWDNAQYIVKGNDYSEKFGYYNRKEQTWYFPEIQKAIVEETK